ncbi:hypothetical protein [Streptomyces sp. NPDC059278]|uniref:hypothetical protein n=1 Tax=Streptomyces sp. NPDC059278 TaxID=3346801 RepID=UPI0036ADBEC4
MIAIESRAAVAERVPEGLRALRSTDADVIASDAVSHRVVDEEVLDLLYGDLNRAFDGPPLLGADLRELRQRIQSSLGRVLASIPLGMTPGGPLALAVSRTRDAMRLDAEACSPDFAPSPHEALARIATAGNDLLDVLSDYGLIPALVDSIPAPPP